MDEVAMGNASFRVLQFCSILSPESSAHFPLNKSAVLYRMIGWRTSVLSDRTASDRIVCSYWLLN